MASQLHRNVFSWPSDGAFQAESRVDARDVGIDLIEDEVKTELLNMVKQSKEERIDEPFCVFDVGSVVERFQLWNKAFPTIRPFYAVKAYDDPVIIKLLDELGAGFDCASKGEIELVQKLGVEPGNIVFSNTVKLPSHLSYAAEKGVSLMSFDSKNELAKIKEYYPEARLLLRIRPTSKAKVDHRLEEFGCHMYEVPHLIRTTKLLDLSLIGVSFHVGSGISNPESILVAMTNAKEVFDIAGQEGIQMNILDIGGGFYGKKGTDEHLLMMSSMINKYIKQNFPDTRVISEPGRYFVESGLMLATSIIGRRDRKQSANSDDLQEVPEFWLSASAFGIVNRSIAQASAGNFTYYPALALREPASSDTYDYCFRGPTCAQSDLIYCGRLPQLQVGDWLIFEDMGAYTVTISSSFNGFQMPPIRRVMKKSIWEALVNPVIMDGRSGSLCTRL